MKFAFLSLILLTILGGAAKKQTTDEFIAMETTETTQVRGKNSSTVTMRFDYEGAEALIEALERDSLSDADVDNLLRIHGIRAMVDNVTVFNPPIGVPEFRQEIQNFARTKQRGEHGRNFQFHDVWRNRDNVRSLIKAIRTDERKIIRQTLDQIQTYNLNSGKLAINVYFVAGGVSDGFLFDKQDQPAFYANLVRANGDFNGVLANMSHEAFHVMQKAAQRCAGLTAVADETLKLPVAERLLAITLSEGVANYVVDPTRSAATGTNMESSRQRYRRNAEPERIKENFALFDAVLSDLRANRITWQEADFRGFSGNNDARFYFVGYEMAKAIEKYCGRKCISKLFEKPPVEFFRQYIALYRKHPELTARFSKETEDFITAKR
ncbi:MAG: hypothetical protein M3209_10485 [Acidobacteriota bacterium]|nr:hypothetical protein [Acidobacteriota bacterium]